MERHDNLCILELMQYKSLLSLWEQAFNFSLCYPGVQNLKSEGETESGIPLPWSGYIATGGLFQVGVEMGVMSQVQVGTYTEFPPPPTRSSENGVEISP